MTQRSVGRPPTFDRAEAVLAAARLFWARGYSGTSTRDLSSALGMSTSSIYAAFGSKAGLFEESVRTYAERYREIYHQACAEAEFSAVLDQLLRHSIEEFTQPTTTHPGCLVSSAAMTDVPQTIDTRTYLSELHTYNEELLRKRIIRARRDGQLGKDFAPQTLAALIQAVWHGLSTQSNQGATRSELLRTSDLARGRLFRTDATD